MRSIILSLIISLASLVALGEEHFKRPVPYGEGRIYVFDGSGRSPKSPSADYVRKHATKVIQLGNPPKEGDVVNFWDYLRWGNSRNDPKIKRRAGPITTVIDLYDRVQPDPPKKPQFDTLYVTKHFIYSDDGDYLELKPPVSTHIESFLK